MSGWLDLKFNIFSKNITFLSIFFTYYFFEGCQAELTQKICFSSFTYSTLSRVSSLTYNFFEGWFDLKNSFFMYPLPSPSSSLAVESQLDSSRAIWLKPSACRATRLNPIHPISIGSWDEMRWVESRRIDMRWAYDDVRLPTTVDDGQLAPVGNSKNV